MANYTPYIKRYWNLDLKTLWDDMFGPVDHDLFAPHGSQIYYGYQGEGKTLSMYHHFTKVKSNFPKTIVVSNLRLLDFKQVSIKSIKAQYAEIQENFNEVMHDYDYENSIWKYDMEEDDEFKITPFHILYEKRGFEYWAHRQIDYQSYTDLIWLLRHCRAGKYGVIFLVDEIHNYFHSHDSKSLPMWAVQVFSQQRE